MLAKLCDPDFVGFIKSVDILLLSETFTLPTFDFSVYFSDFITLHSPGVKLSKMGHVSGGIVMLINKKLSEYIHIIDTKFDNLLCCSLSKTLLNCDKDVLFIGLYNHPVGSVFYKDKDYDSTLELLEQFIVSQMDDLDYVYYLIAGDFNARIGDWYFTDDVFSPNVSNDNYDNTYERNSQDKFVNGFGKKLIQFCSTFNIIPLNGLSLGDFDNNYTFVSERGSSVIDYFLCSADFVKFMKKLTVHGRIESHHMPVQLDALTVPRLDRPDSSSNVKSCFDKIKWDPNKSHLYLAFFLSEKGRIELESACNSIVDDINVALDKFVNLLLDAGQCMKQTFCCGGTGGSRRRASQRWFDTECRAAKCEVRRLLLRFRRSRTDKSKHLYFVKRNQYNSLIKSKKKIHRQLMQKDLLNHRYDSGKFWNTVKSAKPRDKCSTSINIDEWKKHFENVLGQHETTNSEHNHQFSFVDSEEINIAELDREISLSEVKEAIHKLKSGKAFGIDNISAEFLKAAETYISPFLVKLFNEIFNSGVFPDAWSKSIIIPLFKKGDANNPENYRGISLLSVISKVFTYILNKRLTSWAEEEHKICEEQAGFRKNYATTDHIFTLISMIRKCVYKSNNGKLYVAFIDFLKAFDSVDRECLWFVLKNVCLSTKMIRMLQGIYSSVQSCVRWGSEVSDFFTCPSGVKQGCILSPLIFSLLITEVADEVTKKGKHGFQFLPGLQEIFLLLFADDICLLSTTPVGLQNQIDNLEKASSSLGLSVNLSKTKIMIFRKGGHLSKKEKWFFKGQEIEVVNSYKYLGFTLTTKLSFDIALEEFAGRAKGKIVDLFKTMKSLACTDVTVFFKLFDAQIKPLLLYASEIWGFTRFKAIESAHLFACKLFLRVSPRTPNTMVYGELGRYPLYIDSIISTVRYWFKLQNLLLCRLPKQAYVMEKRFLTGQTSEKHSWAYLVKNCFDSFGFSEVWLNGGVGNEKLFLKCFRQRIIDCFLQEWSAKLRDSERYCIYKTFKSSLTRELYFSQLTIIKFRNAFVKFRLGITEINNNKRYSSVNKNCPFCGHLEDELHFLFYCPKYKDLRSKYLEKCFTSNHLLTLKCLLQNENLLVTRSVSMFIYYALQLRNSK